jgi:pimeloyl-ACP methyl ester carboxylesterase
VESFARNSLTFDVTDHNPRDGKLVIALHGFPEDRHCWDDLAARLTPAGYRVLAPDQRGYSPGARPSGHRAYVIPELAADVLALADAAGEGSNQFDVIGHDWGAVVAWELAASFPARVRTLTALSVPHPRAIQDAVRRRDQLLRSWYIFALQVPALPEALMRLTGPAQAARRLERDGLDAESARRYAARLADPDSITGPINWYRALPYGVRRSPIPPVSVPTLYVWGDRDHYLSRYAADRCANYVTGRYHYEVLPASHWLPTTAVDRLAPLILDHLADA